MTLALECGLLMPS